VVARRLEVSSARSWVSVVVRFFMSFSKEAKRYLMPCTGLLRLRQRRDSNPQSCSKAIQTLPHPKNRMLFRLLRRLPLKTRRRRRVIRFPIMAGQQRRGNQMPNKIKACRQLRRPPTRDLGLEMRIQQLSLMVRNQQGLQWMTESA
jgi:hypothetical protein